MRVLIRDAGWVINRVGIAGRAPVAMPFVPACTGIPSLMRGRLAHFMAGCEDDIAIGPANPGWCPTTCAATSRPSPLLTKTPETDAGIHFAQQPAMDVLDCRLKPAALAPNVLRQGRGPAPADRQAKHKDKPI